MAGPWEQFGGSDEGPWGKFGAQTSPAEAPPKQEQPGLGSRILKETVDNRRGLVGELAEGTVDATTAIASGMGMSALAGLIGAGHGALNVLGITDGNPGETVRNIQSKAYQPRTAAGEAIVKGVSYIPEKISQAAQWAADKTFEKTGSPLAATAVDLVGEAAPVLFGKAGAKPIRAARTAAEEGLAKEATKNAQKDAVLAKAQDSGYVIPPSQTGKSSVIEGAGGKIKTQQTASVRNTELVTQKIKNELGVDAEAPLDKPALQGVINKALQDGYEPIKRLGVEFKPDSKFNAEVNGIGGSYGKTAEKYASAKPSPEIQTIKDDLVGKRHDPEDLINLTRKYRQEGFAGRNSPDPAVRDVARAKLDAANAIENMMERNLDKMGKKDLLGNFRDARATIAKTLDVEKALNASTGQIDARVLAKQLDKGRPLSGEVRDAAEAARAFPKSFQDPAKFGGVPPISPLDVGMAVMGKKWAGAAAAAARAPARSIVLSKGYQKGLQNKYDTPLSLKAGSALIDNPELQSLIVADEAARQ